MQRLDVFHVLIAGVFGVEPGGETSRDGEHHVQLFGLVREDGRRVNGFDKARDFLAVAAKELAAVLDVLFNCRRDGVDESAGGGLLLRIRQVFDSLPEVVGILDEVVLPFTLLGEIRVECVGETRIFTK
jgi:hypothetical protein